MSAIEQTAQWVDALWGSRPGWAAVAYGNGPHRSPDGRYAHRTWTPHWYRWPDQRRALLADITRELATDAVDIYAAPHLRGTQSRKKHTALLPMWLHADIDGNVGDPEVWNLLNPIRVQSGSAGHEHGYIALTRALELPTWHRLQRALCDRLGGDTDAKIADNDVLRLPGTLNFKPTVPPDGSEPGEPAPVVLLPGGGRAWEPEELAELLGVDLNAPNSVSNGHEPDHGPLVAVPVLAVLPRAVMAVLERHRDNTDRSAVWQAVINACCGAKLSREEAFAVVCAHVPGAVEKYDGRLVTEFDRSWGKAQAYQIERGGLTREAAEAVRCIYADESATIALLRDDITSPAMSATSGIAAPAAANGADVSPQAVLRVNDCSHDRYDVQTHRAPGAAGASAGLAAPSRADQQYYAAPLDCLPLLLREFVYTTAAFTQVPPEMTLFAALASISFATAGRLLIDIHGHEEPLALYLMQRALPSERKSGALTVAGTGPLKVAVAKYWENRKDEQAQLTDEIEITTARIKSLKTALARANATVDDRNNLDIARARLEELQNKVIPYPVFGVSDATTEGLETLMANTRGVAASFADEAALLQTINGKYSKDGKASLGSINSAWSRRSIFVQRASVTRHIPEPHLVLCQLIQPEPFASLMSQLGTGADGFLSRWLYSEPEPHGRRTPRGGDLDHAIVTKWRKTLHALLERCWGQRGTEGMMLTEQAWETYDQMFATIDAERLAVRKTNSSYAEWLGKAPNGHILRIAALFELIQDTNTTQISADSINRAVTLYDWLRLEARKALGIASGDELAADVERAALTWIAGQRKRNRSFHCITARDLMRGPRKFREMRREEVEAVLTHLETRGWLGLNAT